MSVGKTTLVNALKSLPEFKDYKFQTERSKYLRDLGIPLNTNSTIKGQTIFLAERAAELINKNIITDRTIIDVIAFTHLAKSISYISADKFDKDSPGMMAPGQPKLAPVGFYKAKIEVTPEELAKVNTDINLYPGMPVTVFIVKGTRSFAEYLYSPIKDSFHKAFKEP